MKKTLAVALTAAFVVGATSTTLAAANPFSDVPAGHWAYQSVAKLAAAGVVEGYGDGTYRGDRNITRYEMAQMVAKAMAKNTSGVNKAELDRLAAEFRDELDALGVRVAELEKYADKVKWTGELRYRYWKDKTDLPGGGKYKPSNNQLQMRLFPTAEVNDHWKIKARMTATAKMHDNTSGDFKLTYAFADGTYDKFNLKVGKMPLYTNVDDGIIADDFFSGAQLSFGNQFKVLLSAGRWDGISGDDPASYQGAELSYDNDKLYVGGAYHHFNSDGFKAMYGKDDANIWAAGLRYNFGDVTVGGGYAKNTKADNYDKGWNAGISYKGANKKQPGTWGISAAYRYVGDNVSLAPTYDTWNFTTNKKGVDVGLDWAPIMNTQVYLNYFWGKTLDTKEDTNTFFARASWFF
ncbi:MAG: S-layer homology domain-containing protein [Selenomonadaceae bacterium]|nr:S-layer homology domain-containing protein [Selenomonadaceae bacterium]